MKGLMWMSRILLLTLVIGCLPVYSWANNGDQFSNKVNLALRQIGHQLLLLEFDSTTTIPPIEHDGNNNYRLILNTSINYDSLPKIANRAFENFGITDNYELVVQNATTGLPFLGFNKLAAESNGQNACMGRDPHEICANILVQFSEKTPFTKEQKSSQSWLLILLGAGLAYWIINRYRGTSSTKKNEDHFNLGQYAFDHKNHTLVNGAEKHTLTFRENKLLHLFASQPNEVLNRSAILSAVWEDEGVIVGRSLDVFISRLRKLLKQDPSVQIKNIHGVGYRLEIPE